MNTQVATKKFNLDILPKLLVLHLPNNITLFDELHFDKVIISFEYDLIVVFVFTLQEIKKMLYDIYDKNLLSNGGYLYFIYPQKGNQEYRSHIDTKDILTYFHISKEYPYMSNTYLKYTMSYYFNETYSMIDFRYINDKITRTTISSTIIDYASYIPDIKKVITSDQESMNIFESLSEEDQIGWAKFIFSAKSKATQKKRILEMKDMLRQGYKSRDLYKQDYKKGRI